MKLILSVVCLLALTRIIYSWDLTSLGVEKDFSLLHISLYYIRALLCIRTSNSTFPSLIETTWPENLLAIKPKIFPNEESHAKNDSDCSGIIQAHWTDIDKINRLWLLDIGNEICIPKLIIYDLVNKNKELFRIECTGFKWNDVTSMKLDPDPLMGQSRVYFTLSHGRYLVIFHLRSKKWMQIKFISGREWDSQLVYPHEIAFTLDHRIYIADKNGNLFIADTHTSKGPETSVTPLGTLLGRAKGLITDPAGVLYYILPQHGAVVRWEPTRALNAEGHEILLFQSISVTQIFFGVKGSVWVATDHMQTLRDHCIRILYFFGAGSNLADFH